MTESDFDHDDDDAAEIAAELDDDTSEYAADPDFDLEKVSLTRKCYGCSKQFTRRVSKRSARYQRLCSACRHLADPPSWPKFPPWPDFPKLD